MISSVILIGASPLIVGVWDIYNDSMECDWKILATVSSPDATWMALVQEEVCSGLILSAARTTITGMVELVRRGGAPARENEIFAVDESGRPEDRPVVAWLSPQRLQIIVPSYAYIGTRKDSYGGVRIIIKRDPTSPP